MMASKHSPKSDFGYTTRDATTRGRRYEDHGLEKSKENAQEKAKKDALLEEKIKAIRKKNEDLIKRQKEIEEDKKNANKVSDQVSKQMTSERKPAGVNTNRNDEPRGLGRARGRVLAKLSGERLKAAEWEEKRRNNIARVEEERRNPVKASNYEFLHDERRVDMSKVTGRTERSWGGQDFHNVRKQMERGKTRQHRGEANPEIHMTGKERREYLVWKEERRIIDEERKERAKRSGDWSREWDRSKVYDSKKKTWTDEEGDEVYDRSYRRRQENSRLEDWMVHEDNKEQRRYGFEDGHNKRERRSDKRVPSSSDGWDEGSIRHDSRGSQRTSRVNKKGSFSSREKDSQLTSDDWDQTNEEDQVQAQKFVVPVSEDWGKSIEVETKNSAVDGHKTPPNHQLRKEYHSPVSKSGDEGANKETTVTESDDKNCPSTNSDQNVTTLESATSENQTMEKPREVFENLTVSTMADGRRHVVATSPEKGILKDGTVAAETKEREAPQQSMEKMQKESQKISEARFDDADELVKHDDDRPESPSSLASTSAGLTSCSSELTAPDTASEHQSGHLLTESQLDNTCAVGHPVSSEEEKANHDKKHPKPLNVSLGCKESQEENASKDGATVPTTPDFLKRTYSEPKLDWGEYMEKIEEEPT